MSLWSAHSVKAGGSKSVECALAAACAMSEACSDDLKLQAWFCVCSMESSDQVCWFALLIYAREG